VSLLIPTSGSILPWVYPHVPARLAFGADEAGRDGILVCG
jgi:hypothetical protein